MKFRVRFGNERFGVEVQQENCTVENVKEAICNALSIRDISLVQISLNGVDVIEEDERTLSSLGLVNGDLVYALSSKSNESQIFNKNVMILSQLVDMGFDKEMAEQALLQVNYINIDAAVDILTNSDVTKTSTLHGTSAEDISNHPSTSETSNDMDNAPHIADSVCNPVFCRDGVSATLEKLYDTAGIKTHHHAVFVLIHALMLESGFYLKKENESEITESTLPVGWNNSSIIKLSYIHNLSSSIFSQLVSTSLGPFIYAHVWSEKTQSNVYEVKLVVSQYIKGDVSLAEGARSVYKNLHKVSRVVKNNLVHPLLANIQSFLGMTSIFSLNGIPPEIQLMIMSHLNAASLVSLSATCKAFNAVCSDEKLWQFFCQRDFGAKSSTEDSWKKEYKVRYKRDQQPKRGRSTFFPEFPPDVINPGYNPFLPRSFPSIIGGPHDLFPDFLTGQPRGEPSLRIFNPENRSRSDLRLRSGNTRGTFFA